MTPNKAQFSNSYQLMLTEPCSRIGWRTAAASHVRHMIRTVQRQEEAAIRQMMLSPLPPRLILTSPIPRFQLVALLVPSSAAEHALPCVSA